MHQVLISSEQLSMWADRLSPRFILQNSDVTQRKALPVNIKYFALEMYLISKAKYFTFEDESF